MIQEYKGQGIY